MHKLKDSKVRVGDTVYAYFDDFQGVKAEVHCIHDQIGTISVRIDIADAPTPETNLFVIGNKIPIILGSEEWDFDLREEN